MKASFKVYMALLCSSMIAGIPVGSMAAGTPSPPSRLAIEEPAPTPEPIVPPAPPPPTVEPPLGKESLLVGKTPANFTPPAGWTLVRVQDFEKGSLGTSEWFTPGTTITSTKAHGGSSSAYGRYTSDASDVRWGIGGSKVGSYQDIYISFWEFTESQARFNTEYFIGFLEKKFEGGTYQNFIFNHFHNANGKFNAPSSLLVFQGEGSVTGRRTYALWGPNHTIPTGYWVQRELWYHPNTPGNNDGFARMYENGVLIFSASNQNLNGSLDMGGANVQVGGVYTKHIWRKSDGSCSAFEGEGTGYDREKNWDSCTCSNQCPPSGTVPKFNRYFDDIIIMKR